MFDYFIDARTANHKSNIAYYINTLSNYITHEATRGANNCTYVIPAEFTNDDIAVLKSMLTDKGYWTVDVQNKANTIVIWWSDEIIKEGNK